MPGSGEASSAASTDAGGEATAGVGSRLLDPDQKICHLFLTGPGLLGGIVERLDLFNPGVGRNRHIGDGGSGVDSIARHAD
jgi:hypothetical protein